MPRKKRLLTQKNLRAMGMDSNTAKLVNKATAGSGCLLLVVILLTVVTILTVFAW